MTLNLHGIPISLLHIIKDTTLDASPYDLTQHSLAEPSRYQSAQQLQEYVKYFDTAESARKDSLELL